MDVENLGAVAHDVITQVVENLPSRCGHPTLAGLSLYVRADKQELWRIWAEGKWPAIESRVRGVQHFTNGTKSKNSADIAITADATADFVLGRTGLVAVVSNDSDFGALFVKIREMAILKGFERTPFLWVTSEGGGALSPEVERFVPDEFQWKVTSNSTEEVVTSPGDQTTNNTRNIEEWPASLPVLHNPTVNDEIAHAIVRHIPVGTFRASDVQKVVRKHVGSHPSVPVNQAQFAQFLLNDIAPALEGLGVQVDRKKKSPKRYTITPESKRLVRLK